MRLTIITQYYKPEMGAPQNRLLEMVTSLQKCGADVSVITGMPNYPTGAIFPEYRGLYSCTEVLDDIEVKRYWLYASNARKLLPKQVIDSTRFDTRFAVGEDSLFMAQLAYRVKDICFAPPSAIYFRQLSLNSASRL